MGILILNYISNIYFTYEQFNQRYLFCKETEVIHNPETLYKCANLDQVEVIKSSKRFIIREACQKCQFTGIAMCNVHIKRINKMLATASNY